MVKILTSDKYLPFVLHKGFNGVFHICIVHFTALTFTFTQECQLGSAKTATVILTHSQIAKRQGDIT